MLDPQRTLEREAQLRRHGELQAEIAQHERNMREGEARLPIEDQLRLNLRRFIEANIPELAGQWGIFSQPSESVKQNVAGSSTAG